jgi:hypothetical protein
MTAEAIELSHATWRKSSYSGGNGGQCVEVALSLPGLVAVRDSKRRDGSVLAVDPRQWTRFVVAVKAGAFDPA